VLHQAISQASSNSRILARNMGILVQPNSLLTADNHGIIKRFHKQWAYSLLVKPLYEMVLPASHESARTTGYLAAILSMVRNCPLEAYADDVEKLVRVVVIALGNPVATLSAADDTLSQALSALHVLGEILHKEPEPLTDHLKALITGVVAIYTENCQPRSKGDAKTEGAQCRTMALQVLGAMPNKFEERHLLAYAPRMQRMLAAATGDAVREVRKVALQARKTWGTVA
jgi:DNA repair/transcription protein MET18/MMS19